MRDNFVVKLDFIPFLFLCNITLLLQPQTNRYLCWFCLCLSAFATTALILFDNNFFFMLYSSCLQKRLIKIYIYIYICVTKLGLYGLFTRVMLLSPNKSWGLALVSLFTRYDLGQALGAQLMHIFRYCTALDVHSFEEISRKPPPPLQT